ncbi:MAG: hypothetical protein K2W99_03610 [Chthoniobacterales bacterium]|nr:hypothetical protein [Chthoniobacterales bacterium]
MVFFYLPEHSFPSDPLEKMWREELPFQFRGPNIGDQAWVYYTWHLLTRAGVRCQLTTQFPSHGIVLMWNAALLKEPLSPDVFLVDIATYLYPHPKAGCCLVQNRALAQQLPNSLFVPHWPQPSLQPRELKRSTRFENICFLGEFANCAPELQSEEWFEKLRHELGLFFELRGHDQWHNYRDVDAVVAVRSFSKEEYLFKPPTKLYNAWLAGVPFIGGFDSAFAADGIAGKNYLVAQSQQDVFDHLKHLKEDLSFRTNLIDHGLQASKYITKEATLRFWKKLVEETLPTIASGRK